MSGYEGAATGGIIEKTWLREKDDEEGRGDLWHTHVV